MNGLSQWIYRFSTGRVALIALLIFLIFTATVLPAQSRDARESTGGVDGPDLRLFYSAAQLYDIAEDFGEEGRADYIRARFTFDLAWPAVYTFFLVTAIGWLFRRGFDPGSWARGLNLVPLLAASFDLLENLAAALVMFRYPEETPVVAFLAGPFTAAKWLLVAASFLLLVVGLVLAVKRSRAIL